MSVSEPGNSGNYTITWQTTMPTSSTFSWGTSYGTYSNVVMVTVTNGNNTSFTVTFNGPKDGTTLYYKITATTTGVCPSAATLVS